MKKSRIYLLLFTIALLTASCKLTYRVLLGVDSTPEWKSEAEILKLGKKYDISPEFNLIMDTTNYFDGLKNLYREKHGELELKGADSSAYKLLKRSFKDDSQPVQFRLFDKAGSEIFKIVNCYVDPPIPMNWNVDGCFDSFPPKIEEESLNVHNFDLDYLLKQATRVNGTKLNQTDLPETDYYGVVVWNEFFKRPSKRLLNLVDKRMKEVEESITMLYINNQNAYLWAVMDSTSKVEIQKEYFGK